MGLPVNEHGPDLTRLEHVEITIELKLADGVVVIGSGPGGSEMRGGQTVMFFHVAVCT